MSALADHWRVLRTAWAMERDGAADRQRSLDQQFLPAALEIVETPPSPGLRWLLLILCSLFAVALAWAFIGRVDVVAVAGGKVVSATYVKVIQPIEIGAVRAIHVRNGQRVRKGQLLIELDPTLAGADDAQASQGLLTAQVTQARNTAILGYLNGGSGTFVPPPGTPPAVAEMQGRFVRTAIAEYRAERAALAESRAQAQADLQSSQAEIAKLEQTLPLVDQQLEGRRSLADKGYFSKLKLLEYQQLRVEHVQNIAVQRSAAAKARAAIGNLDAQIARLRETFGKAAFTDLAEAEDKGLMASAEIRKTVRRREYQELRSPVDGVVQQLAIKKSRASFAMNGDGVRDDTGWVGKGDGLLVIDRNGDGRITDANELSFLSEKPNAKSDLEGLAALDANRDGTIEAKDARFGELKVWADRNRDGTTQDGELLTLADAGIASIGLKTSAMAAQTLAIGSNAVLATATFSRTDGRLATLADVALAFRPSSAPPAVANRAFGDTGGFDTATLYDDRVAAMVQAMGGFGAAVGTIERHGQPQPTVFDFFAA